jgi:hypothetical protein
MKVMILLLILCSFALAQQTTKPTWGCSIRPPTDKVEDFLTLDCKERDSGKAFVLDIPKKEWPKEWSLPGEREFYFGAVENGLRVAIKTPATHCDTEFHRAFGGNRVQSQLCGVMFPE